jgi:hypothetical protein
MNGFVNKPSAIRDTFQRLDHLKHPMFFAAKEQSSILIISENSKGNFEGFEYRARAALDHRCVEK